jgi:L-lactate dehydrogenase complex protein LldG
MSSAREDILGRIREALRLPAPKPHLKAGSDKPGRAWLPEAGETQVDRLGVLAENLTKLRAQLVRVPDLAAAKAALTELARSKGWKRLAYHAHPDTAACTDGLPCEAWSVDQNFDKHHLESCDVGLTSCEAIVAQTGSILVSSATNGGRALSILPHIHVVIGRADQVVGDLTDAFALMRSRHGDRLPSMLSFITGPSRTGDIERILVLGAHGPKELVLILVG